LIKQVLSDRAKISPDKSKEIWLSRIYNMMFIFYNSHKISKELAKCKLLAL
jgi:hypothetical protein